MVDGGRICLYRTVQFSFIQGDLEPDKTFGAEENIGLARAKIQARGLARRQAMLDAATELFLEQGFERTSLSDIVSRSKGSRSTLYEQFGNKEGLLRAMVEEITGDVWEVVGNDEDLFSEEGLVALGMRFVRSALAPRSIAVFRVLISEAHRVPEIAELFFERGPRTCEILLAERFRSAPMIREGYGTPEQLGQIFVGAVLGVFHARHVLGLPSPGTDMDVEAHVRTTVRVFLDGIGRPAGG